MQNYKILQGAIAESVYLTAKMPEFNTGNAYKTQIYQQRLHNKPHLILVAKAGADLLGFKVGYALDKTIFYSWMGGVLPNYRRQGIARALAIEQERWAAEQGFKYVRFKTRNYLKSMLLFGIANGFEIVEVIKKDRVADNRIILEKAL